MIGNLQVGGSGKTPHTAMLYKWLKNYYRVGILSRGYGRKTKGLIVADHKSSAKTIGDEPFWYYSTLEDATIVVAEERKIGLQYFENHSTQLVLLDDAYQHRAVTCNLNVLLTDFNLPYYLDHVMPYGRLREWKTEDRRAHIIVVTKCPRDLKLEQKIEIIQEINPYDYQHIFFTGLKAQTPYSLKGDIPFFANTQGQIIAMSGIANPESFTMQCSTLGSKVVSLAFEDHHHYTQADIRRALDMLGAYDKIFITEKDASKLVQPELLKLIPENTVYVLPVEIYFLFNEEERFKEMVKSFLK